MIQTSSSKDFIHLSVGSGQKTTVVFHVKRNFTTQQPQSLTWTVAFPFWSLLSRAGYQMKPNPSHNIAFRWPGPVEKTSRAQGISPKHTREFHRQKTQLTSQTNSAHCSSDEDTPSWRADCEGCDELKCSHLFAILDFLARRSSYKFFDKTSGASSPLNNSKGFPLTSCFLGASWCRPASPTGTFVKMSRIDTAPRRATHSVYMQKRGKHTRKDRVSFISKGS